MRDSRSDYGEESPVGGKTEGNFMKITTRTLSIVGAFALAAGVLAGCSSAPAMTQEEACTYLETETNKYMDSMEDKYKDVSMTDPKQVVDLQKEMIKGLESIGNGVGNAEVKKAYNNTMGAAKEIMTLSEKAMTDPSVMSGDEYAKTMQRASETGQEFAKVCPTAGGGLFG